MEKEVKSNPESILKTNIYKKIFNVIHAASKLDQSGYNDAQKYKYSERNDMLRAVKDEMKAQGLLILMSQKNVTTSTITRAEKQSTYVQIEYECQLVDTETGEMTEKVTFFGTGVDPQDKALYKAATGAEKYFLRATFMLSGDDDAEKEEPQKPQKTYVQNGNAKPPTTQSSESDFKSRSELTKLLTDLASLDKSDPDFFTKLLVEYSEFTFPDGKKITGVNSVDQLKDKRLYAVLQKVKSIHEKQFSKSIGNDDFLEREWFEPQEVVKLDTSGSYVTGA